MRKLAGFGAMAGYLACCGLLVLAVALATACGSGAAHRGSILIEGSSTLFPLTQQIATEFKKAEPRVDVKINIAGTGGGFQKFCNGETVIQDASRPINFDEIQACAARGIQYIELPIARDALSVVVMPITTGLLASPRTRRIWEPAAENTITRWHQINATWPETDLRLFGPDPGSGTFDYFTEQISGRVGDGRQDYTRSEDDNFLVQAVGADRGALGYVGFAYYLAERYGVDDYKIQALQVNGGSGCVLPAPRTVDDGTYPLARPLFIYVRLDSLDRREVTAFVDFYLDNVGDLAEYVGYVRLRARVYDLVRARWDAREPGTMYTNAPADANLEHLLQPQ
jgi:phosphate transport system substrate-binding protein